MEECGGELLLEQTMTPTKKIVPKLTTKEPYSGSMVVPYSRLETLHVSERVHENESDESISGE